MTSALPRALRRGPDPGLRLSHGSWLTRRLSRNQRKSLIDSTVLLGSMGCLSGAGLLSGAGRVGSTGHLRHRGLLIAVSHSGRPA
ncbi:hypothetical protein OG243_22920 [Streptomyces sp. NBC_01318]|uniref:hypothetical protein n=1 Tax=Streptomyces sp. NBC_01318 TaxID=2903823 RepID=UPI002E0D97E8|nr:hypothetical protein OG243_22920 [Streptomyces sp. NBC_01318]